MRSEALAGRHREGAHDVPHCSTPGPPCRHVMSADALKRVPTPSSNNFLWKPRFHPVWCAFSAWLFFIHPCHYRVSHYSCAANVASLISWLFCQTRQGSSRGEIRPIILSQGSALSQGYAQRFLLHTGCDTIGVMMFVSLGDTCLRCLHCLRWDIRVVMD